MVNCKTLAERRLGSFWKGCLTGLKANPPTFWGRRVLDNFQKRVSLLWYTKRQMVLLKCWVKTLNILGK